MLNNLRATIQTFQKQIFYSINVTCADQMHNIITDTLIMRRRVLSDVIINSSLSLQSVLLSKSKFPTVSFHSPVFTLM